MIEATTVYAATTGVYVVALVVLLGLLRRVPEDQRSLCYPVVFVVGVAGAATALLAAGLGTVAVGGGKLEIPTIINDLVSYSLLWVVTVRIVDVDGRALAFVALTPVVQSLAFRIGALVGGVVGLVGLAIVVGGHIALGAYILGPIWNRTAGESEQRRLLHWKARNLLLFMIGVLIAFGVLSLTSVFDEFVTLVIGQYMAVVIRVGFAGFLFANLDVIGTAPLLPANSAGHPAD